ncbi:MAG: hypothetical protein WB696_26465 [Chthoniobacterales bacterium]
MKRSSGWCFNTKRADRDRARIRITRSTICLSFPSTFEGFLFISQLAIKQMLAQKTGGSIVNITSTPVISHWTPLQ